MIFRTLTGLAGDTDMPQASGLKQTWIDHLLYRLLGKPKSLEELIGDAMTAERALVDATRNSIRRQEFDLHMSLSRIRALEEWNHGNVRKDLS